MLEENALPEREQQIFVATATEILCDVFLGFHSLRSLHPRLYYLSPSATGIMSFIELHARSAFSFLSSGSLPEEYAAGAAEYGMPAIALIDRDTVSGVVRFHHAAQDLSVKAIVGAEITMDDGSLLPLIPLNLAGYQNLCRLITTIKLRAKKGEHAATRKDIEEHSQNLLCITGGADGFLHKQIKAHRG